MFNVFIILSQIESISGYISLYNFVVTIVYYPIYQEFV